MVDKPTAAAGYRGDQVSRVKEACLYLATKLGDLIDDLVIVGGLVPSLLIEQDALPAGVARHVGTMDLDLGLAVALLTEGRYQALVGRLRRAGFAPDVNEHGNPTRQRWSIATGVAVVAVDFLIAPSLQGDQGGKIRNIEHDFAAVITPGLHLAFMDRRRVQIVGRTIVGEEAARNVWVCGPGAYIVLKALAFDGRGENKDAYDLYYLCATFGAGIEDVAACLEPLRSDPMAKKALQILQRDFLAADGPGPRRVAEFVAGTADEDLQADVAGVVRHLLSICQGRTEQPDR